MRRFSLGIACLLAPLLLALPLPLPAGSLQELTRTIGSRDALAVAYASGRPLVEKHAERPLIPASTLKILTSTFALRQLGADFRFATEFYVDENRNLKVKGYGDPLLISEVLAQLSVELAKALGKPPVSLADLVLDDSYFASPLSVSSQTASHMPYDAPNGALCVNFNTVYFKTDPAGDLVSAEPQTPLLAPAVQRIERTGLRHGRIVFSHNGSEATYYAGHLLRHFLNANGLKFNGRIRLGKVHPQDRLVYRYRSIFELSQVVARLMRYSNNFIANQLLICTGAKIAGPPGTLPKGAAALLNFAQRQLQVRDLELEEGSGLARENKISARDLLKVLDKFAPHRHLMRSNGREYYKTGTLKSVRARAGYLQDSQGNWLRFAVLINTPGKTADKTMQLLREFVNSDE